MNRRNFLATIIAVAGGACKGCDCKERLPEKPEPVDEHGRTQRQRDIAYSSSEDWDSNYESRYSKMTVEQIYNDMLERGVIHDPTHPL